MILGGVARVEKRQGRCDGVGSGVNGGEPSASGVLLDTVDPGALLFGMGLFG